jgi:hypothetical protein
VGAVLVKQGADELSDVTSLGELLYESLVPATVEDEAPRELLRLGY